jgi:probable poly-beta-1,6-N-acetyl-D-glucosamine export protein
MGRQFPFLRGLAIIFVLLNHSVTMSLWMANRLNLPYPEKTWLGIMSILQIVGLITVPIFLFLSGAFFAFGLNKRPLKNAYKMVWQNILNVLWPYLIWTVLYHLVMYFLLKETLTPFLFIKYILVGYPYNFVPILLFFYAVAPILIWCLKKYPVITLIAVFAIQAFLAIEENEVYPGLMSPAWMHYLAPPVIRQTLSIWAIFFPLGCYFQLNNQAVSTFLRKYKWAVIGAFAASFGLVVLNVLNVIVLPVAGIIEPIFFVLLIPIIQRQISPIFQWVEAIGKHSYGFYLANLIIMTLVLFGLKTLLPFLLQQYLILIPLLFILALYIPWGLMKLFESPPQSRISRYVFG